MIPLVTEARVLDGNAIRLRFSDGSEGVWDFASMVARPGSMVEPLRDPAYFRRVFVEDGALTWPNGFDVAPDALHEDMAAAGRLTWPNRAA